MKTLRFILTALLLAGFATRAFAADGASVRAILITGSNEKGETDRRLAAYEQNLKRILRFERYAFVGEGSTSVPPGGAGSIGLPRGHRLQVAADGAGGRGVRVKIRWSAGGDEIMDTGLSLNPGVPAILGGPSAGGGEVYAVILIAR